MTDSERSAFEALVGVCRRLRGPDGCPWDREQTLESMTPYLTEEAAELVQGARGHDRLALHLRVDVHRVHGEAEAVRSGEAELAAPEAEVDAASDAMSKAYKDLDAAIEDYKKLGGTIDYRAQIQ